MTRHRSSSPLIPPITRRGFVAGAGSLTLSFALSGRAAAQSEEAGVVDQTAELPGSLSKAPFLDSWIRIAADGAITVFTGKAELGQGIRTALHQIAAEMLGVDPQRIELLTADTDATPNEGYPAASHSMEESGSAIMNAAAEVRAILVQRAAERLGVDAETLRVEDGVVIGGPEDLAYDMLVDGETLHVRYEGRGRKPDPATYKIMGTPFPRTDIPAKLTGAPAYVQDLRLPGMVHARVIRPPIYGARLAEFDQAAVKSMPGVTAIVRNGNYLAVVASGEYQAVAAKRAAEGAARWTGGIALPERSEIYDRLQASAAEETVIHETDAGSGSPVKRLEARYTRPFQMHSSIGPSCAVGLFEDGRLTVWTHTQGVYPDRKAIAELLSMEENAVRLIHMPGAGCYGHNGADDAAADAALIATALPGRPVRVQWMREDEHLWEPYGSAMVVEASAGLAADGTIADWTYDVWSYPHSTRPGGAGNLIAGKLVADPFRLTPPTNIPQPAGGGDRNAVPPYPIPGARVTKHFVTDMTLRVSALRGLGAFMNVFSLESFVDELAEAAGADPVAFRLAMLDDPRAKDVVAAAATDFGWDGWTARARGFAYARYKNLAAYCAVAIELQVTPETGAIRIHRAVSSVDSGQIVNPDGVRNQVEGGIVQSASWTLFEEVLYSPERIESRDWSAYPILRFDAVPASVTVRPIDRPGEPFLGTGECAQGPTAAAIANAVRDATGVRIRDLPYSPKRLQTALRETEFS